MPKSRKTPVPEPSAAPCCDWKKNAEDLGARAEDFARREPTKAVGAALLVGLLLTVLPVGRLAALLVRAAFTLLRPVLLVVGAMKVCAEIEKRNNP